MRLANFRASPEPPAPAGSEALVSPLRAARSRLAFQRRLEGAVWAGSASVLVLGALELLRHRAGPGAPLASMPGALVAGIALAVFGLGMLGAALYARRSVPDLLGVARLADRELGLDERLSTALECGYAGAGSSSGAVLSALARDAELHAARVRPEALARLHVPGQAWLLAVAVAGVIAVELLPPRTDALAGERGGAAGLEAVKSSEEIAEAAMFLQEEAAKREDPQLLQAAADLRELGEAISGEQLTSDQANQRLAELLTKAADAMQGSGGPAVDESSTELTEEEWAELAKGGSSQQAASPPGARKEGRAALNALMSRMPERQGGQQAGEESKLPAAQAGMQGPGDAAMATRGKASGAPPPNAELQFQQMTAEQLDEMRAGSDMSMSVPGSGAGSGSSSFDNGLGSELRDPRITARRNLELSLDQGKAHRRAPGEELPPDTKLTAVGEQPVVAGPWRAGSADALAPDRPGISYREIASRYFISMSQQPKAPAAK